MAALPDLFDPPVRYSLPLSKGGDLYVAFVHRVAQVDVNNQPVLDANGAPVFVTTDYPLDATVTMTIETTPTPLEIEATIDGAIATCWAQSQDVDLIPAGKLWRAVAHFAGGLDTVLANGLTNRKDGDR